MKRYVTSNYVLQLLLSGAEGIKIIDMLKKNGKVRNIQILYLNLMMIKEKKYIR